MTSFVNFLNRILIWWGYKLNPIGYGYIDPAETILNARLRGQTIVEYLESKEKDLRKKGRRNRIIDFMNSKGVLKDCLRIVEIGAGTGMYAEKVLQISQPAYYEIYETHFGWRKFLKKTLLKDSKARISFPNCDGKTLNSTDTCSCDLVHAHAVFVYIPILSVYSYIKESSRVLKQGGYLIFDCFLDVNITNDDLNVWSNGEWNFPVILSEKLILNLTNSCQLRLKDSFSEIYGDSKVDYLIFEKTC